MDPVTFTFGMAMQGIFGFFASLPKLLGYAESAVAAIAKMADAAASRAKSAEMANAIEHAKITKDTSKIEDLFNPRPKS